MDNKRDQTLDIAKGIGAILVVYGHLVNRNEISRIFVYSFHMPLFFIISGYLNKKEELKKVLKKCTLKLILPVYVALLFDCVVRMIKAILLLDIWPSSSEWIDGVLIHGGVLWNLPIWFLLTLFICRLFGRLEKHLSDLVSLICVLICVIGYNTTLPQWWLTNIVMAFPFYWLGLIAQKYDFLQLIKKQKINIFFAIFILWIITSVFNGYTDIHIQLNGKNYILFLFTGVMGTVLLIKLSYLIRRTRCGSIMKLFGQNSIFILLSHYYICRGIIPRILNYCNIKSDFGIQVLLTLIIALTYFLAFKIQKRG